MVYIAYLNEINSFLNYLLEYKSILIKEELLKSEYNREYISINYKSIANDIIEKISKLDNIYTCNNSIIYKNLICHLVILINKCCINSDKKNKLVIISNDYTKYISNLNKPKITGEIKISRKLSKLDISLKSINSDISDYNEWYSEAINQYNNKAFKTDKKYNCSECAICLNKGIFTKLSCGHSFHIDCID
jgi:hypothetical protein